MENYFVLNHDITEIQAIDALETILQDEGLRLTRRIGSNREYYFFVKDTVVNKAYGKKDVDGYQFDNLEEILDNFEDFHQSCFLEDLDTDCDAGIVEFGDYNTAIAYLLTSKEFRQLLRGVTPVSWPYPVDVTAEVNQMKLVDFAEKLLCKEILSTMSAYALVEDTLLDVVWLSKYGIGDGIKVMKHNPSWSFTDWWHSVMMSELSNELFTRFESYAQLLQNLQTSVTDDFNEMGNDFYLNKAAMCLMGLNWLICGAEQKCTSQSAVKEPLTQADKEELYGQFIDIFEDFLEDKKHSEILLQDVAIAGDDYDELRQGIENLLVSWNLI